MFQARTVRQVTVSIKDVNDHTPMFTTLPDVKNISEVRVLSRPKNGLVPVSRPTQSRPYYRRHNSLTNVREALSRQLTTHAGRPQT